MIAAKNLSCLYHFRTQDTTEMKSLRKAVTASVIFCTAAATEDLPVESEKAKLTSGFPEPQPSCRAAVGSKSYVGQGSDSHKTETVSQARELVSCHHYLPGSLGFFFPLSR